jgi:hypothetical protein
MWEKLEMVCAFAKFMEPAQGSRRSRARKKQSDQFFFAANLLSEISLPAK